MRAPGWYYRLSSFFREKFGVRVTKIPLNAGLTCPNRDGALSEKGCIFCYNPAFSPAAAKRERGDENRSHGIRQQIRRFQWQMEGRGQPAHGDKEPPPSFTPRNSYLAYFQAYSNTYGPHYLLDRLYNEALQAPGVIGLSVATRPDCLSADVLDLLTSLAGRHHIWLELGLQSAHDRTLKLINRGHNFACFQEAVQACQGRNLYLCVHLINGLPGEDPPAMLETVKRVSALPVHGVKFHQLQILAGTSLEPLYRQGAVSPLSLEEYLRITCDQLELLRDTIVVHRLLAETPQRDLLLAPDWHVPRARFAGMVEVELRRRGTHQGKGGFD
ncbi:MAG: TIGR01212 family radical SAM protein [Bacillota bacterium]